jgi:predicted ribosomally synthesized peptide with nif11-like leader
MAKDNIMSQEAVFSFLKSLDKNEQLQNELKSIPQKSRKTSNVVEFAQKHGFDFTPDELEQEASGHAAASGTAINEEQLSNVVGGLSAPIVPFGTFSSRLLLNVHSFSSLIGKFNVG